MDTTLMIRDGFGEKEVPQLEVKGHLKYGWRIKTDQDDLKKETGPKEILSKDYGANPVNVKKLREALTGKTAEEIEAAFEGEGREKILEVKKALLASLQTEAPQLDGKAIVSGDFSDDEQGIEALKAAVKDMSAEDIVKVFENEKRESVLKVYTEITE